MSDDHKEEGDIVIYLKLITNDEIIGRIKSSDIDVSDSDDSPEVLEVKNPLKIIRAVTAEGEYVGFSPVIPMQLSESLPFNKHDIILFSQIMSIPLIQNYSQNIPQIAKSLEQTIDEANEDEQHTYH